MSFLGVPVHQGNYCHKNQECLWLETGRVPRRDPWKAFEDNGSDVFLDMSGGYMCVHFMGNILTLYIIY